MNARIAALTLVTGLIAAAPVLAVPINPSNDRSPQVVVGNTTDPDTSCNTLPGGTDCELQTLIDVLMPAADIDVNTDQQAAGMWQLTAGLSQVAVGTFALEVTANAPNLQLGIWSDSNGDTDMDGRTLVDIFLGGATGFNNGGQTRAVLEFTGDGLEIFEIGSTGNVNENTFSGINPGAFGFYIQPSGDDTPTWYSLDQLNPAGAPQMLAFRDTNSNLWALGFEDAAFGSGDNDFQDVVFTIESIVPVPEPGTLVLFGSGILALGLRFGARRRTVA